MFDEASSSIYDRQHLMEFCARQDIPTCRYELLDDRPDERRHRGKFGLWRVQSVDGNLDTTWTEKPVVAPLRGILAWCKDDPGGAVPAVGMDIAAPIDVHWALIGAATEPGPASTCGGPAGVWDPVAEKRITLGSVNVTVTDRVGRHGGGWSGSACPSREAVRSQQ